MFDILEYFHRVVKNHNFLKLLIDQHHQETNHQIQHLIYTLKSLNSFKKHKNNILLLSFNKINSIVARASSVGSCSRRVFCIKRLNENR